MKKFMFSLLLGTTFCLPSSLFAMEAEEEPSWSTINADIIRYMAEKDLTTEEVKTLACTSHHFHGALQSVFSPFFMMRSNLGIQSLNLLGPWDTMNLGELNTKIRGICLNNNVFAEPMQECSLSPSLVMSCYLNFQNRRGDDPIWKITNGTRTLKITGDNLQHVCTAEASEDDKIAINQIVSKPQSVQRFLDRWDNKGGIFCYAYPEENCLKAQFATLSVLNGPIHIIDMLARNADGTMVPKSHAELDVAFDSCNPQSQAMRRFYEMIISPLEEDNGDVPVQEVNEEGDQ